MGPVWAIVSAIIFGLAHVGLRRGLQSLNVANAVLIEVSIATVAVGVAAVLIEGFDVLGAVTWNALLYLSAAGIVHFLLGWSFLNASTQLVGAARMSALASTSPFFAALLAVFLLHERPNVYVGLGTVLVVVGIWLTLRK